MRFRKGNDFSMVNGHLSLMGNLIFWCTSHCTASVMLYGGWKMSPRRGLRFIGSDILCNLQQILDLLAFSPVGAESLTVDSFPWGPWGLWIRKSHSDYGSGELFIYNICPQVPKVRSIWRHTYTYARHCQTLKTASCSLGRDLDGADEAAEMSGEERSIGDVQAEKQAWTEDYFSIIWCS